MKTSRTRKKLFITCIIFMCVFIAVFVAALQMVTESAYTAAIVEAEINEMQQIYETYFGLESYYEQSSALFTDVEYIEQNIVKALNEGEDLSDPGNNEYLDKLVEQFSQYTETMDIYVVDSQNIMCLQEYDGHRGRCFINHNEGDKIDFINDADTFDFLERYGLYTKNSLYNSSQAIVKNLSTSEDIYIIGIPRYDKIFDFTDNQIVIYNKFGLEQLRLNTEELEYDKTIYILTDNQNYRKIGIGRNRFILCYFSNEDELGHYSFGTIRDIDLSFRYYIYLFLLLFFAVVGIILWRWSDNITKPLDFFVMWMKLVKDKGSIDEDSAANTELPKENHTLQNNIMLYFSFCLIPIIIAGATQWYAENQILNSYVEQRYVDSAEFYGNIIDAKFYTWRNPVTLLCNDDFIGNTLEKHYQDKDADYDIHLIKYIRKYTDIMQDDADTVTIYNSEGTAIVSSSSEYDKDRYIKYRVNVDTDYKWEFTEGLSRFTLHQKIYNDEGEIIGYCKLELNDPDLRFNASYNSEALYSCYIYKYTDKVFNLIGSPLLDDEKVVNMIRETEEQELSKSIGLKYAGINYFYIVKGKVYFDRIWDDYVVAFMNIVFFIGIAVFFAAGILTRATINPIIHLSNALYNDSPQIPMSTLLLGKEEFALIVNRVRILSEQVDAYAKEQKLLEKERQEHEKRRKDAEMLTLQTQINPHFMYNIFSSISVLIRTGQSEKAANMVMHTGNLMRLGLYRGHVMIPLKEEIDHVTQYIKIQQIRYNNCMEIAFNIDESLMQLKVVKFVLQPIIENAIEHNVGYLEDRILMIDITAFKKDDDLIIEIADNGRGLESTKMSKLQNSINSFDMSNHLGLANINERIKLNCGEKYGVTLEKNDGDGLKVELRLPVVVSKEEQRDV